MSMAKAGKRPLRSLTAHEKLLAVKRVSAGGESKASVARDIGVPESTLRGWCKNQAKIFNQARASPNHLDGDGEAVSPAKRSKLDEPYNLSMKDTSDSSYSPSSQFDGGDFAKTAAETEAETPPINLVSTAADKEREKNRAELARLSAELGLNRPEVFLSGFGGSNSVNETILFWNSIYNQLTYQQKLLQQHQQAKFPAADAGSKHATTNGAEKRDKILPNTEQQPSVHDSVSYWLRQQTLMGMSTIASTTTTTTTTSSSSSQPLPTTAAVTTTTTTTTSSSMPEVSTSASSFINSMSTNSAVSQMRLWNWYKQSLPTVNQLQAQLTSTPTNSDKQILYQQLVKPEADQNQKDKQDTENDVVKEEKPRNNGKNRSVLDNIFINNSMPASEADKDEPDSSLDIYQAVRHGEKFLKWLESCSDPSVTAVQIVTLQSLIKNLKKGFDRKNGDHQNTKTKVRRK
ncbi:LOW QUALITY PROTEIN: protein distal antenna [Rhynchophorus ferrugineus]|uniref:LOW QUALITY PROTEIN: protein distal antenna n=1 Tax=Rhynchophorus ferrugineus TaxID=354439 RepID=UPI003FCC5021